MNATTDFDYDQLLFHCEGGKDGVVSFKQACPGDCYIADAGVSDYCVTQSQ